MKLTVTDSLTPLPARVARQQIVIANVGSSTAFWGWERSTAAAGANQGLPLDPGAILSFGGEGFNVGAPIFFICADGEGTEINYTQK